MIIPFPKPTLGAVVPCVIDNPKPQPLCQPIQPRVGVDFAGRCMFCGLYVRTSAGCPCQFENKEGPIE